MKILNYTGHPLHLAHGKNWVAVLSANHDQARVSSKMRQVEVVHGVPILQVTERSIRDLPDPQDDVLYVVSGIVAAAAQRPDVLCPGRIERDENGEVICAKALIRLAGM